MEYDAETGFYYVSSRYYDPEIGRWINADNIISNMQGMTGFNLFVYCGNNPVNHIDPSGMFWNKIGNWLKKVGNKIEEYLTQSNIYGCIVDGTSITLTSLMDSVEGTIKNSVQPNNIGVGTYVKQCAKDLKQVSKFKDGVSKTLTVAAYGTVALDVGISIHDNISRGASSKKIILDATVDTVITGGSVWGAGAAGSAIGTAVGSIIPGAGNLVGAGAGFVIGIGIGVMTDMVYFGGKTVREWAKEGVNNLW